MIKKYIKLIYPRDHIVSIGDICNLKCIYCANTKRNNILKIDTAKQIIDFITSIPNKYIYLEFTGGEPFLITDTLSKIIYHFKTITNRKSISNHISIVSNLQRLTEKEIKLILKNHITICTSLDGPKELHNITRQGIKDSYSNVSNSLNKIIYYASKDIIEYPNIITTITKYSLDFHKEIIDEYIKFGVMRIQLGMVEPIGNAKDKWKSIGITSEQYIKFYEKALDYILKINIDKKIPIYEKGFMLLLKTIKYSKPDKGRSIPILNRVSYDSKGFIHPDDESRMLFEDKKLDLRIGDVNISPKTVFSSQKTLLILDYVSKNSFDNNCKSCPYANYCYIPLWYRIITIKSPLKPSKTQKCRIFKAIFDIIFYTLKDKRLKNVIDNWIKLYG